MENKIEGIVANVSDLQDGEMQERPLGEGKILLVKEAGKFYAVGHKCLHYGAPLKGGSLMNGTIRCPWHSACFNIKTGDIEDFPSLDCIPTYEVRVEGSNVIVSADPKLLQECRVTKFMHKKETDKEIALVIGGGPAGATVSEVLRQEGFKGRVIMVCKEQWLPYDRPKLSKAMTIEADRILLRSQKFYDEHDIEVLLSTEVTLLDHHSKTATLSNGSSIQYTVAFVCTGGIAQNLSFIKGATARNIFTLRTPDDAHEIVKTTQGEDVVIIGSSFIGMEVASCIAEKSKSVTVVGMEKVPFERVLGHDIGFAMQKLHESKKVKFIMEDVCMEFKENDGKVTSVLLKSGLELKCGAVIIGAGIKPATSFIKDSESIKKSRDQSLITDKYMNIAPGLYAAGDVVSSPLPLLNNKHVRVEHYAFAQAQGRTAASHFLGKDIPCRNIPTFWTTQYGKSLRFCGFALDYDEVIFDKDVDGFEKQQFAAYYAKEDKILAVCSLNRDPIVAIATQLMNANKMPTASEIKAAIAADGTSNNILKAKL